MNHLNWQFIQDNADAILYSGMIKLIETSPQSIHQSTFKNSGNYLISLKDKNLYIGEGKALESRLKQQANPSTSTFYKTFVKLAEAKIPINLFQVKAIETNLGRKEMEEFGIVNLETPLNKFQLGKREKFEGNDSGLWDVVQSSFQNLLLEGEDELVNQCFVSWYEVVVPKSPGIYLVKNKEGQLIYIGESSDILERYKTHSSKTYFSALRRHIGTELLNYQLIEKNNKKQYFTADQDADVSNYLHNCSVVAYPISIGRYEMEEYLIKKYQPFLNRKAK